MQTLRQPLGQVMVRGRSGDSHSHLAAGSWIVIEQGDGLSPSKDSNRESLVLHGVVVPLFGCSVLSLSLSACQFQGTRAETERRPTPMCVCRPVGLGHTLIHYISINYSDYLLL